MANKRFCASVARRYATQQPIYIEQQLQLADYELTIRNQHHYQIKCNTRREKEKSTRHVHIPPAAFAQSDSIVLKD